MMPPAAWTSSSWLGSGLQPVASLSEVKFIKHHDDLLNANCILIYSIMPVSSWLSLGLICDGFPVKTKGCSFQDLSWALHYLYIEGLEYICISAKKGPESCRYLNHISHRPERNTTNVHPSSSWGMRVARLTSLALISASSRDLKRLWIPYSVFRNLGAKAISEESQRKIKVFDCNSIS